MVASSASSGISCRNFCRTCSNRAAIRMSEIKIDPVVKQTSKQKRPAGKCVPSVFFSSGWIQSIWKPRSSNGIKLDHFPKKGVNIKTYFQQPPIWFWWSFRKDIKIPCLAKKPHVFPFLYVGSTCIKNSPWVDRRWNTGGSCAFFGHHFIDPFKDEDLQRIKRYQQVNLNLNWLPNIPKDSIWATKTHWSLDNLARNIHVAIWWHLPVHKFKDILCSSVVKTGVWLNIHVSLQRSIISIINYPPGNWHIPTTITFEDDLPFTKVFFFSSLEGI